MDNPLRPNLDTCFSPAFTMFKARGEIRKGRYCCCIAVFLTLSNVEWLLVKFCNGCLGHPAFILKPIITFVKWISWDECVPACWISINLFILSQNYVSLASVLSIRRFYFVKLSLVQTHFDRFNREVFSQAFRSLNFFSLIFFEKTFFFRFTSSADLRLSKKVKKFPVQKLDSFSYSIIENIGFRHFMLVFDKKLEWTQVVLKVVSSNLLMISSACDKINYRDKISKKQWTNSEQQSKLAKITQNHIIFNENHLKNEN